MNRNIIFLFFFLACTQPSKDQQQVQSDEPEAKIQEEIVDTIEKEIPKPEEKPKRRPLYSEDSVKAQGFFYVEKLSYLIPDKDGILTVDSIRIPADRVTLIYLNDEGANNFKIKRFPYEVLNLKNLEYIWMGMRGFKELPSEITQLKKLRMLDLQHGAVQRLPENIHELENLEVLCLLGSGIKGLPENMENLQSLRKLDLGLTKLEEVPRVLFKMSQLESLNLSHLSEVDGKKMVLDTLMI
ncbi:MAG: hypothetical protein AAFR66_21615, partial [Bacteroidota bacterium]